GVVQDNSGRRVIAWIDPMYSQGPPHLYKSNKPGIAPDCRMKLVPQYADDTAAAPASSTVGGYANVSLPPARQQLIGVKLGKAEYRTVTAATRTVGRVAVDERRLSQVHAKFEGVIEALHVSFTGQPVRRGQPLLAIYSPDVLATQRELILAQQNRSDFGKELADAARHRLRLWDMSDAEIAQVARTGRAIRAITLRSPATGVVLRKDALLGARVMPENTLYEIADLSSVWVLADVYESDLATLRIGQTAQVTLTSTPGRTWPGRITFVSPVLDEATRTAKVRLEIANPDGLLKPDMYANVSLQQSTAPVLTVPDSAVLQTGTRSVLFIARGNGQFEPREVQTGAKGGGFIEIRSGVAAGDTVVVDANFLIDSESRLKSALSQMER
ncbi:MAG TPA: efflux RND transporter periplasmic adaptor subunit, partial [Thermoanaerobaculia bacterium]